MPSPRGLWSPECPEPAHSSWCPLLPPEEQSPTLCRARPGHLPLLRLHSWWSAVSSGSAEPGQATCLSCACTAGGQQSTQGLPWDPFFLLAPHPGPLLALPCGGHPGAVARVCTSERGVPKALWADEGPRRSLQVLRSSPRLSCLAEAPSLVILAHSSSLLSSGLSSFLTHLLPLLPLPQLPAVGLASCGQREVVGTPGTSRDSRKWEPPTFD
ncbi:unnamed protein product [Rangifer tarandus platyrhynchus]|uniref:Uncharacterized protein n=1 Tax=Rangifer tarandus platyrhynchus TaxID=3082113 RepID=A0AC59ZIJ9_RANTA